MISSAESPAPTSGPTVSADLDLDAIHAAFDGVDAALRRLDDGSYWTDEITGEPLPDELLAGDPTARRAGPEPAS